MKLEKSKVDEDVSESIADDLLLASLETHHPSGTKHLTVVQHVLM